MTIAKSITLVCSACHQSFTPSAKTTLKAKHPCCYMSCRSAYARSFQHLAGRFWSHVLQGGPDECWPWQGRINPQTGYGEFDIGNCQIFPERTGHNALAHRVAYLFHHGAIIPDLLVCHSCDMRACANCAHLWQGTSHENAMDMVQKGRAYSGNRHWTRQHPEKVLRGENHPQAKVSDKEAETIYDHYRQGGISQKMLGESHGVSQYAVWRITHEKRLRADGRVLAVPPPEGWEVLHG